MKIIYNTKTGKLFAILHPTQDEQKMLANYTDAAILEVDETDRQKVLRSLVDLNSNTLIKNVELERGILVRQNRIQRNALLNKTDWTQMSDNALTEEQRATWRAYRQLVREVDLENPIWPIAPET